MDPLDGFGALSSTVRRLGRLLERAPGHGARVAIAQPGANSVGAPRASMVSYRAPRNRLIRRRTRDRCRGAGSAGLWAEKRDAVVIQGSGEGRATETGPSPNLYRRTRRCRQGDGARSGPSALCAGRVLARAAEGVLTAARANTMSLTQPKSWGVSGFMSPSGPSRTHPSNSSGLRHIVFARERSPRSVEGRSPRRARIAGRRRRCGSTSGRSDGRLNAQ